MTESELECREADPWASNLIIFENRLQQKRSSLDERRLVHLGIECLHG